jgi:HAMP domain-containing protein
MTTSTDIAIRLATVASAVRHVYGVTTDATLTLHCVQDDTDGVTQLAAALGLPKPTERRLGGSRHLAATTTIAETPTVTVMCSLSAETREQARARLAAELQQLDREIAANGAVAHAAT